MNNLHTQVQLLMVVVGAFLTLTAAAPQLLAALPEGVSPDEQQGPPQTTPNQICSLQPGCIGEACIQHNHVINGRQGQSVKLVFLVPNGKCAAPLSGSTGTAGNCQTYPNVRCAQVTVYTSLTCDNNNTMIIDTSVYKTGGCIPRVMLGNGDPE